MRGYIRHNERIYLMISAAATRPTPSSVAAMNAIDAHTRDARHEIDEAVISLAGYRCVEA